MKTLKLTTFILLLTAALCGVAHASSPAIDTINVQGYLTKPGGTTPVDSGTYTFVMAVEQNSVIIWGKQYASVNVVNGLFSISLSGMGQNLNPFATPCPAYSGLTFAGITLGSALLTTNTAGLGEVSVHVCGINIDSNNPNFDVNLGASPTAMVADVANGVASGSIVLTSMNASALTDVFHASSADANKIVTLGAAGGTIDVSLIPPIAMSTQVAAGGGSLGLANGGTNSANGSIQGTGATTTFQSANGNTTILGNNSGLAVTNIVSGTGGILETVSGNSGGISFTAGANTGNVSVTPGTVSGTVTIGSGASSGATSFGNGGGASATNIVSGTSGILLNPAGIGQVRVMNGNGINLLNGAGSITVNSPVSPTSYNLLLPSTGGVTGQFLQTTFAAGTATTSFSTVNLASSTNVSGVLPIANGGSSNGALAVTNGSVVYTDGFKMNNTSVGTAGQLLTSTGGVGAPVFSDLTTITPTGALTLGGAATTSTFMGGGGITMDPSGTITVGVSPTTTGVSIDPGGTVDISPTAGGMTINPVGGLVMNVSGNMQLGGILTSSATLSPSGTVTINPTGNLTLGGAQTVVNNPLVLNGATAGSITLASNTNVVTPYVITFPNAQGAASTILVNDGTGALTWDTATTAGLAASGNNQDIGSLNPTGGLALGGGNTSNISANPGASGTITLGDGSTGAGSFGNTGLGSVDTFQGGSGVAGQTILTSNGTGASAVAINAAGAGGSVNITANTTGNIALTQGTASGLLTLGSSASTGGATLQGAGSVLVTSSKVAAGAVTVSTTGAGSNTTLVTSNGTGAGAVTLSSTGSGGSILLTTGAGTGGAITVSPDTIVGGTITVGNSSIGNSTFGNTGLASLTTLQSGTGGLTAAVSGTTGNILMSAGSTSGSMSIGNASTGASFFGNTGATSPTTILGGATGGISLGSTGLLALNLGNAATGALTATLGSSNAASTTLLQSGTGNLSINAPGITLGNAGTLALNLGGTATGALTTTLGSTAAASVTNINSGTGGINFVGLINGSGSVPVANRSAMLYATTAGLNTAYTLATSQASFTLVDGASVTFQANATCGANPTLAVNSTAATKMENIVGLGQLTTGDILKNGIYKATFSLAQNAWMVERVQNDAKGPNQSAFTATAGSGTAWTLAIADFALYHGAQIRFTPGAVNIPQGASPTLNVNGTGAKAMADLAGNAFVANAILKSGVPYTATYDGNLDSWIVQAVGIQSNVVFPATATNYTVPNGLVFAIVEVLGPGASGGGADNLAGTAGSGGGAGGYVKAICYPATLGGFGGTNAVVFGTGGAGVAAGNTIGNSGSANATFTPNVGGGVITGSFGVAGAASGAAASTLINGGAGGAAANTSGCTTIVAIPGQTGGRNNSAATAPASGGGYGGSSPLGYGGAGGILGPGVAGTGNGSGGGGGGATAAPVAEASGAGTNGIVIVTEYRTN